MMFSWTRVSFAILSLSLLPYSVFAVSYWVDSSCLVYADFTDTVTEVIWNAGKVARAINSRDAKLESWLRWMFGFGYTESDAMGNLWADYVYETFNRIGQMSSENNRAAANIRFYCDDDNRWSMVNKDGNIINTPADRASAEYRNGVFWDQDNNALLQGRALLCKTPDSLGGSDLAWASMGLAIAYDKIRARAPNFGRSAQNADREVISICAKLFADATHLGALTWRDLARLDLSKLSNLPGVAPSLATVLTHELVHNPLISGTTFYETSGSATVPKKVYAGTDEHPAMMDPSIPQHAGNTRITGKYKYDDTQLPGERLAHEWAIMNPDSYAHLATLYRLYGKQWNSRRGGDGKVTLFFDRSLPIVGDSDIGPRSPCKANSDCTSKCCDPTSLTCASAGDTCLPTPSATPTPTPVPDDFNCGSCGENGCGPDAMPCCGNGSCKCECGENGCAPGLPRCCGNGSCQWGL